MKDLRRISEGSAMLTQNTVKCLWKCRECLHVLCVAYKMRPRLYFHRETNECIRMPKSADSFRTRWNEIWERSTRYFVHASFCPASQNLHLDPWPPPKRPSAQGGAHGSRNSNHNNVWGCWSRVSSGISRHLYSFFVSICLLVFAII